MTDIRTRGDIDVAAVQRRTLGVLSTYQGLSGIAVAGAIPAGALIAAGVSGSEAAAGFAQTSGVVGAALAALPLARLTLARGRRGALAVGVSLGALGAVVVLVAAVVRSFPLVVVGCMLVGAASASNYQARYAAADLAVPDRRARDLSIVVWASTIGAILGPNLLEVSGRLAVSLGLPQLSGPYLVAAVCLGISAMLMVSFLRPDPYLLARRLAVQAGDVAATQSKRLRDAIPHMRQHAKARLGITSVAIGHAVMVMVMVMTPVHMRHVDVQLQLIGLVISVHVAGMYALSPLVGMAADRFGRRVVIGAGVAILALACVLGAAAPADDVPRLGVALFLLGLGWSCTLIGGSTLLVEDVAPGDRPAVQGASDLVMNVAGAVGGIVAGIVVAEASYAVLCLAALVPVVSLGAYVAISLRRTPAQPQGGSSPV